jgi:hypothetical protein
VLLQPTVLAPSLADFPDLACIAHPVAPSSPYLPKHDGNPKSVVAFGKSSADLGRAHFTANALAK